jgi:hypothetical protein
MKTGPDVLGTAENEYEASKHQNGTRLPRYRRKRVWRCKTSKRDPTPSAPPTSCPGAQNLKTGPDAVGTAEYEFGRVKHENETRRPRYRRKMSPRAQNMKTEPNALGSAKTSSGSQNMKSGPDGIGTAENECENAKLENETRRPRNRRKRIWERKNMKTGPDALGTAENESRSGKH